MRTWACDSAYHRRTPHRRYLHQQPRPLTGEEQKVVKTTTFDNTFKA
jgi:hypothetical protein